MTALLGFLLSNPTMLATLAGFIGALGWGFRQRLAGAKAERDKQAAEAARAGAVAAQVQNDTSALSADAARKELDEWSKS